MKTSSLIRAAVFVPLYICVGSMCWATYREKPFNPIRCVVPFSHFLINKYILRGSEEDMQKNILQLFIDNPEMRNLAIPPEHGGPKNQMVFVIEGFTLTATLFLVMIPVTLLQSMGFILSLGSTVSYILSVISYDNYTFSSLEYGSYANIVVSMLGIISCIV